MIGIFVKKYPDAPFPHSQLFQSVPSLDWEMAIFSLIQNPLPKHYPYIPGLLEPRIETTLRVSSQSLFVRSLTLHSNFLGFSLPMAL